MKLFVNNVRAYLLKFLLNTWVTSLRVNKYGFVLLSRLGVATNTVFSNPITAKY